MSILQGPNEQLHMFRFAITVMRNYPKMYKPFMKMELSQVKDFINQFEGTNIERGMSMDKLVDVIDQMNDNHKQSKGTKDDECNE